MRWIAIATVSLVALLGIWGFSGSSSAVHGTTVYHPVAKENFKVTLQEKGELKAVNSIDIKCEVEGRSTIISLVPEGTHVKKGDLLVELASANIEERVQQQQIQVSTAVATLESAKQQFDILLDQNKSNTRQAKLKLDLAELEFKKYQEGEWPQQLQDANLRVEESEKILKRRKENLEASKKLVEKNHITRTEYETDEFDCYKSEVDHQKAVRDLQILQEFTHVKDLQQKQSDVEETQKELARVEKEAAARESEQKAQLEARDAETQLKQQQLKKLQEQMAKTKIFAPADGLVVYGDGNFNRWGNDTVIKEGSEVFERQTLMQLPDTSKMMVVIRVHEAQTDKISIGQQAVVNVEGVNGRHFTGKVSKIAVLADSQNRWLNPELKEYETEITLDQEDLTLKPGVTAKAEVLIAELRDVVAVPIQSVYNKGPKSYVFVGKSMTNAKPVEVQLGLSSSEKVQILSGVEENQNVLLAVNDDLKRQLPEIVVQPTEFMAQPKPENAGQAQKPQAPKAEQTSGGGEQKGGPKREGGPRPGGKGPRPGGGQKPG